MYINVTIENASRESTKTLRDLKNTLILRDTYFGNLAKGNMATPHLRSPRLPPQERCCSALLLVNTILSRGPMKAQVGLVHLKTHAVDSSIKCVGCEEQHTITKENWQKSIWNLVGSGCSPAIAYRLAYRSAGLTWGQGALLCNPTSAPSGIGRGLEHLTWTMLWGNQQANTDNSMTKHLFRLHKTR